MILFDKARIGALLLALSGCASQTVPALSADQFTKPELSSLQPRELTLTVTDERSIPAEDRTATVANVRETLQALLEASGIRVEDKAPNTLTVRLEYPKDPPDSMDRESCVAFVVDLLGLAAPVKILGLGCADVHNAVGMSYGSDITKAFAVAIDQVLLALDQQSEVAVRLTEPPLFDAGKVVVPEFLKVSTLTLDVTDSWSENNEVGASLHEELGKALEGAGVKLGVRRANRLTVTVSKPKEGIDGRNPDSCIQLEAKAKLSRTTVLARTFGCQGADGAIQHQVLNDVLRLMDEQYRD
jgi:hypothetical protein